MIQLSSLMWTMALFFTLVGFLRGWNRELVASAGIVLALFAVFQTDALLRGFFLVMLPREQLFLVQAGVFIALVVFVYRIQDLTSRRGAASNDRWQSGILGSLVGFVNGYMISGSLWYLLDIHEYPLDQFVTAPALNSPTAQALNTIPLVLIGGGASGSGDLLAIGVIALLFLVLIIF